MARQLAKASQGIKVMVTAAKVWNAARGKPHFHFCSDRECRLIYEDNCRAPERNGRCQACRGQRRPLTATRDPQECCINNCQQVIHPDDLLRYALAGPGPWYQCITCRRAHGWPCTI